LKDNLEFFEMIKDFILKNEQMLPFKSYKKPKELLHDLKADKIKADLLIIDIEEKRFDEIVFVKKLQILNKNIQIIIISSCRDRAVEAFKINALDYLLKPLSRKRLKKTAKKVEELNR